MVSFCTNTIAARALFFSSVTLVLLGLTGCKQTKPDQLPLAQAVIAPGAQGWEDLTMALPVNSPAVVRLMPSQAIGAMDNAFSWMIAEPAMFGEGIEGEERVRGLKGLRAEVAQSFGKDPFDVSTWSGHGVALDQPAYLAFYPLSSQGQTFVKEVETELETRLNTPGKTLREGLKIRGEDADTEGLYSTIDRLGRHSQAALGVRVLMGLQDEPRALDMIDNLFSGEDYARVARVKDSSISRVYFTDRSEDVLTMVVRTNGGKALMIDAFYVPLLKSTKRDDIQAEVMGHVTDVLSRNPAGRASAPAPSAQSVASLGTSQEGISEILRYLSYKEAILEASTSAATARDEQTYVRLGLTILEMSAWDTGARGIQGTNYALEVGGVFEGVQRMFGFEMELFGEEGLKAPEPAQSARSLGVNQSGAGLSMDTSIIFSQAWKTWLAPRAGKRLLDIMGDLFSGESPDGLHNFFFAMATPRLLAQLLTVAEDELKDDIPLELVPVYAQREHILRVEALLPGLDLSNSWRDPNVVALITISPELSTLDRDALSAALRDTLYYAVDFTSDNDDDIEPAASTAPEIEYERAQAMTPDEITAFNAPASHKLSEVFYYYDRDADAPYIILSRGSNAEQNLAKLVAAPQAEAPAATGSFRMKLEPSVLLQLSGNYEEAEFSFINLPLFTQRVGSMLFNITPDTRQGDGVIEYRFDLLKPATLDSSL